MKQVEIFTDGACKGNPGPGGWGAILRMGEHEKELSGSGPRHHQQPHGADRDDPARSQALKSPCEVKLHTDSHYVIDGITKWIFGWQSNGWKTAAKKPVLNAELWQELLPPRGRTRSTGSGSKATPATRKTNAPTCWRATRRWLWLSAGCSS